MNIIPLLGVARKCQVNWFLLMDKIGFLSATLMSLNFNKAKVSRTQWRLNSSEELRKWDWIGLTVWSIFYLSVSHKQIEVSIQLMP